MRFSEVIGQQAAKERLIRSAQQDRVPQALLLLGKEGTGGLPLAMAFAQYLNCENPGDTDSCGECGSCKKASKIAHPDIHYSFPVIPVKPTEPPISDDWMKNWREAVVEDPYMNAYQWLQELKAENKQGNITVRECHTIIRKLNLKAFEGKYKVQIIWMPEYLGDAGNILLKIIEEPPANTVFLLVAENQDRILNTILSRTQQVQIPMISDEDMAAAIMQRHNLKEEDAHNIALIADGNYLSALHLIRHDADENAELFQQWIKNAFNRAYATKRSLIRDMMELNTAFSSLGRENQKTFCRYGLFFMREVMSLKSMGTCRLQPEVEAVAAKVAKLISYEALSEMSELLNNLHYFIERNGNPRILIMNTSLQAKQILAGKPVGSVGNL